MLDSTMPRPLHPKGGYDEVVRRAGQVEYLLRGVRHRTDGPALITREGDEHWYLNGELHNEGAPAIITRNGAERFYTHGKLVA